MTESDEHRELADAAEREAGDLERSSEQLGEEIGEVRSDWRRKQADPDVPGAEPGGPVPEEAPEKAQPPGGMERE
jgi:hypothetical protein